MPIDREIDLSTKREGEERETEEGGRIDRGKVGYVEGSR